MENRLLIVVDMQNDFINGALGTQEAINIVPNIVEKINNWNGYIIATKDTHNNNYLNTIEGQNLPIEHCIFNTEGWEYNKDIDEALQNKKDAFIGYINKHTFGCIDLFKEIYKYNFIDYTLIGVCTDICIINNAFLIKSKYYNNEINIDSNCCAGTTPENHQKAIDIMKICHINIQ